MKIRKRGTNWLKKGERTNTMFQDVCFWTLPSPLTKEEENQEKRFILPKLQTHAKRKYCVWKRAFKKSNLIKRFEIFWTKSEHRDKRFAIFVWKSPKTAKTKQHTQRKEKGKTKKETTWKNIKEKIYFSKIKWCQKKQEIQNLIAKQVWNTFQNQNNTFSKINLFVGEKGSQQRNRKKNKSIFQYEGFLVRKCWKHETGDAKGDKKKNNMNQMENGTRKTCVRKIKTRRKRKTQREQSEKKGDEQMKKIAKKKTKNQRR